MLEKAYAKINLSLNCLNKRDDGYHNLESIVVPISLHDAVEVSINKYEKEDDYITCDQTLITISKYNSVRKMLNAARQEFGFKERFNIHIHKNIFLQAGLGGSSADAGAVLRAIIRLLKLKPTREQIINIAIKVGSDVPWSFFSKPALLLNKGEVLEEIKHKSKLYCLIVKPVDGCSTPEVFKVSDTFESLKMCDINAVKEAYINDDLNLLDQIMSNSLQEPAISLNPNIQEIINTFKKNGLKCVMMSGSGSSVFALSKNKNDFKKMLTHYDKLGYQTAECELLN